MGGLLALRFASRQGASRPQRASAYIQSPSRARNEPPTKGDGLQLGHGWAPRVDLPAVGLWLIIISAALDHFSFRVTRVTLYPENVALVLVVPILACAVLSGRFRWNWPAATVPLGLWLTVSLISTLFNAPSRSQSLILWNKLALVVAVYLVVANLARRRPLAGVQAQLLTAAVTAGYAVLAFGAWRLAGSHWGMEHAAGNLGQSWLPQGAMREPNILGSFAAAGTLLGLATAVARPRFPTRIRLAGWLATGACLAAVVLSGARTVWVSLAICLAIPATLYMLRRGRREAIQISLILAALGALGVLGIALNPTHAALPAFHPHQNGDIVQRLVSFGSLSKERDLTVRFEIYNNALAHWRQHPLIGWGTGAYGESFRYPPPDQVHAGWISNLPVHVLYDSGLLGLLFFLAALAIAAWRGMRTWFSSPGPRGVLVGGLLLALLALFLAFQTTEATWFAYPWVFLGLLDGLASQRGIHWLGGNLSRSRHLSLVEVHSQIQTSEGACASR